LCSFKRIFFFSLTISSFESFIFDIFVYLISEYSFLTDFFSQNQVNSGAILQSVREKIVFVGDSDRDSVDSQHFVTHTHSVCVCLILILRPPLLFGDVVDTHSVLVRISMFFSSLFFLSFVLVFSFSVLIIHRVYGKTPH
jgi:hypothetical protein